MAIYQHKNGRWYLNLMIEGNRFHQVIPEAKTKKQAELAEAAFKLEASQGRYPFLKKKQKKYISLAELVEKHIQYVKTNNVGWSNDQRNVNYFLDFVGNINITSIKPETIEKFKNHRKQLVTNGTVNRELNTISKMFSIAVQNGWLSENPCFNVKKLRVENKKERFLTIQEEQILLAACTDHQAYLKPIILCALQTGMRKSEILSLKWDCVNFTQKYIDVLKTKSGRPRKIPISSVLLEELRNLTKLSEYVFTNPETLKRYFDLNHPFQRLCKKAGIKGLRFHDLRHTSATRMVAAGIDLVVVQDILGHHNIQTTMRYSHPVPERKMEAIAVLANYR